MTAGDPIPTSHRERKKQLTRQALVDSALRLFAEKGYERTTIAEITAAVGIAPRTFFSYFQTKEDVLFTDSLERLETGLQLIRTRRPGETIGQLLARLVSEISLLGDGTFHMATPTARARIDLLLSPDAPPTVQARAMWWLLNAQQVLAEELHRAYAEEVDLQTAAAVVGSVTGALITAAVTGIRNGTPVDELRSCMEHAAEIAFHGIAGSFPTPTGSSPRGTQD